MKIKQISSYLFILVLFILMGRGFSYLVPDEGMVIDENIISISSFAECERQGYPVKFSFPSTCKTEDGRVFTDESMPTGPVTDEDDLIRVSLPRPFDKLAKNVEVMGMARGEWFWEAIFPVSLHSASGDLIWQAYALAEGEWETENFVPFRAEFELPDRVLGGGSGTLILRAADNDSGLRENKRSVSIPVSF